MKNWNKSAIVWVNDPLFRSVVVGPYGFVWAEANDKDIVFAPFGGPVSQQVSAFQNYKDWDSVQTYDRTLIRLSAVYRFVRTGLQPKR